MEGEISMLFARNTPNNAGVAIHGDFLDFEKLYEALHEIVHRDEGDYNYFPASTRVLSVCYDIRHALKGDREFLFVNNGLDDDKKRRMSLVAPDKNMYYKINILWPEALFVLLATNDLLNVYAKKEAKTKTSYNIFAEPRTSWNENIAAVRMFQAAINQCLATTITPGAYTRLINLLNSKHVTTKGYLIQYIDQLNDRFLKMDREKRLKNISISGKRIAEKDGEYEGLRQQFIEEAHRRKCRITDLRIAIDDPEEIDW